MQVKVLSDTHNDHRLHTDLECDILVHCGDYGIKGTYTECRAFLEWFVKQPSKYKIVVPGNHDGRIKKNPELSALAREYGIHVLMNDLVVINNKRIWGGDFVPWYRDNVCQSDLRTRKKAWENMEDNLDLLVTHVPPKGILDANSRGERCGCDQLRLAIKQRSIKKHVFGHIHEHGGKVLDKWATKFYNCAVKDINYLTVRDYKEFII